MSLLALVGIGFVLNAAAAVLAAWRGSVDPGGAAAGTVVGTLIFGFGGPLFWLILMAFFVSSTAAGKIGESRKGWLDAMHEKGGRRDAFQVLANGGMGMLTAVLWRLTGNPAWAAGFAVSFASSNADTWGSEIGVLSRTDPVSPLTFRRVPRGISGGMSGLGSLASFGGALFIGLAFAAVNLGARALPGGWLGIALFVTVGGSAGSLVDSILGATVQAEYASGSLITERRATDGVPNPLVRGVRFVNNDVVNIASCAVVTAAAVLLGPVILG